MKIIIMAIIGLLLSACDTEPPVAGSMSVTTVCSTAGYLIRQRLGREFKTVNEPCRVSSLGGERVEIESGYVSPIGQTRLRYTAIGVVYGNTLRLDEIRVHGVDAAFIPFQNFP
ncbi:hypothetical protein [Amphritea sp. HPY]|uniref:hypothetical protein n=1 Tax=Amphritea sp. HPY TaxID=3421652 RepID=UPI003D7E6212